MRKLNALEKEIVIKLVNYRIFQEEGMALCFKFLEDNYIGSDFNLSIAIQGKEVMLLTPTSIPDSANFRREKIVLIITFFSLITELNELGKIKLIGHDVRDCLFGPVYDNKSTFTPDINELIINPIFKFILLSQELIEYVKQDFRTEDEIHYNQTLNLSKFGLYIALSLGIVGIAINIIQLNSSKSSESIKLDSEQFKDIAKKQELIITNQNKILNNLTKDSLIIKP